MLTRSLAVRAASRDASRSLSNRSAQLSSAAALFESRRPSSAYFPTVVVVASRSSPTLVHPNIHRCLPTSPTRYFTAASTILPDVKLYQYHICPFCNVTKSLLSYSKLDYESVEVNPLTKSELKPWSGEYKKVPIAMIDGNQINGSENILESILNLSGVQTTLEKRWAEEDQNDGELLRMTMQQFQRSENALLWTRFAIDDLAALLYPNICGSLSDSYDAFGYVRNVDSFSALQKISIQYLGALAMHFAARKVKSKRNIVDEKAALKDALDKYESEGLQNGKITYSSGLSSPDLGDIAVFGVLYSVRGLNAHRFAIQSRGGAVKEWYDRMSMQVLGRIS